MQYDMQTICKHALKNGRDIYAVKHAIKHAIIPAMRLANNMQTCITKYARNAYSVIHAIRHILTNILIYINLNKALNSAVVSSRL